MKREMICILCPRGCNIIVDEDTYEVTGNSCPRGAQFGPQEIIAPERLLTTTANIKGARHPRIPVRSSKAIPKAWIKRCVVAINEIQLMAPVRVGDVLIENILDTGVDIIASRTL